MADFDEATLKEVARTTGGVYFNATSLEGFKEVYRQIDKLSETEQRQPQKPLVDELFAPFAMAGLLALLLSITLNSTYFRKAP
jgi:Ca-activated chloride channel family protein